jgi:hypothetical protein
MGTGAYLVMHKNGRPEAAEPGCVVTPGQAWLNALRRRFGSRGLFLRCVPVNGT